MKDYNFKFFEGKSDEEIAKMLTSYKKFKGRRGKGGKKVPIYKSFNHRWKKDRFWKKMLCDIQSNLVRRLYDKCFREECSHMASSHDKASRISYGLHFDHQKEKGQWHKVKEVSSLRNRLKVEAMTLEMIKCRLVCGFDHEFGSGTDGYEDKLKMSLTHQYQCGQKHRTIKNIIESRNMKLLLLELKSRGAFKRSITVNSVSWGTLNVLFWKYARVDFAALVNCTDDEFNSSMRTRTVNVNRAYIHLIKKLAVKCPGCRTKFTNLVGVQLSGVHMDHRGKKGMHISVAICEKSIASQLLIIWEQGR